MKITDHTNPRVRIIENFIDTETCKKIVDYVNANKLWSLANADMHQFESEEFFKVFSKQWDDRKLDLNDIVSDHSNEKLVKIVWEIKESAKLQVEDFFDRKNEKVFLECWEIVRWFYPYQQAPHIDYLEPNFNRATDLPEDFNESVLPEGTEDIYLAHNTTKHFTSMLYLNEDFEGGELYFPQSNNFTIKPKAGMLVIFSGHLGNPHGVTQITDGTRYVHTSFWSRTSANGYYITEMIEHGCLEKYWEKNENN